jgi:hypothetical protein
MQKALHQVNMQLTHVLTDITGTTGLAIIRAIVAGERDPVQQARFRASRCASSTEEIAKALTGHDQPEHVFALKQALALYDAYTDQVRECDGEIERRFQAIKPVWLDELPPLGQADKLPTRNKNEPTYDARSLLYQLVGVDLIAIPGRMPVSCKRFSRKWAWTCGSGPMRRPSVSGWGWLPTTGSREARSCAGARSRPAIVPVKPFGSQRKQSVAATTACEPTTGRYGPASGRKRPSWLPPTNSRVSSDFPLSTASCRRSSTASVPWENTVAASI